MRVMAERGYERATIHHIAEEAGLAAGLLHYHFGAKQQILVSLVETLGHSVQRRIEAMPAHDSARDRLFAIIDAYLALGDDADPSAVAAWVAIGAEACTQPEVRAVYAAQVERTAALFARLLGEWAEEMGGANNGAVDARAGAAALLASIEGAYQLSVAAPGVIPAGSAARSTKLLAEALVRGPQS